MQIRVCYDIRRFSQAWRALEMSIRVGNLFRFSFYRRIQISFLLLILLPTVVASYVNYASTQKNVKEKILLSNESVLTVMAKDVSKMIDDFTYTSNFFVQDENVRKRLQSFRNTSGIHSFNDLEVYSQIKDFFSLVNAKTMNTDVLMY